MQKFRMQKCNNAVMLVFKHLVPQKRDLRDATTSGIIK